MNEIYRALSDPTRRRILELLREQDMTAGELADHFDLPKPTLSRHFSVLREADLVQSEKNGTSVIYSLNTSVVEDALVTLMERLRLPRRKRR